MLEIRGLSFSWQPVVFVTLALLALIYRRRRSSSNIDLPLPPGPRPLPILGNVWDFPLRPEHARALTAKYGEVVYLNAFGTPVIILGTHQAAVDLLEKRSSIYSERNMIEMAKLTGFEWLFTTHGSDLMWRKARGAFHRCLSAPMIASYQQVQKEEVKRYLLQLLEDHDGNFSELGRKMIGTIIIRTVYGLDTSGPGIEYIHIAEEAMACFNAVFGPGRYLVQTFPWLRFVPSWFPGAGFQREFAEWRPRVQSMLDVPWAAAVALKKEGYVSPSTLFATLIERIENNEESEYTAKCASAAAYFGGADTTVSTLRTFFAAMAANPEVQKRAQEELDSVIGLDRLPTIEDKPSLPYITALMKECLRWRNVVPLSVPHVLAEDDEYKGYYLPKGSAVISNIWLYSRDPRYYPDPEAFKPERYLKDGQLDKSVMDPSQIVFGYGRRICPGRFFAEASVFVMLSNILHTFVIASPTDANGKPIHNPVEMTFGVVSYPEPFECIIKPRSAAAESLIRSSCAEFDA